MALEVKLGCRCGGEAAPGAGRLGVPTPSHWVRDSKAACERVAPLDGSREVVGRQLLLYWWLAGHAIAEASMFE